MLQKELFAGRNNPAIIKESNRVDFITLYAPAKVNLYLDILSKRSDGYHNIETIFQKIDLCDTIRVSRWGKGISIDCKHPYVPKSNANIAYKAARLMKREFGIKDGISIQIKKRIPPAAGLGGGSSDAASVIVAITKLFGIKVANKRLIDIAKKIGADVPFFVSGYNCAIGKGIGERLKELKRNMLLYLVLLVPGLRIHTKTVYKRVSLPLTKPASDVNMLVHALSDNRINPRLGDLLYNRLEEMVLSDYPIVREAKNILSLYNTMGVLLSGSGPSVFGIFNNRKEAMRARGRIKRDGRWQVYLVKTI